MGVQPAKLANINQLVLRAARTDCFVRRQPCRLEMGTVVCWIFFALSPPSPPLGRAQVAQSNAAAVVSLRNTAPQVRYVGSRACAECHRDIYDKFIHTDMGRSILPPGEAPELAALQAPVTVTNEKVNRRYELSRQGLDFSQSDYELDSAGREVFRHTEKIAYVVGAGANGVGYLVRRGNFLFEAPLSYYADSKSWEPSPGYELHDFGFSRAVRAECLACHSGRPRPVRGQDGACEDPPFDELAIGCENCHGAGELHVAERRRGVPLPSGVDTAIVNPAKLPAWLADNICMACHERGDARVLKPGKQFGDFRPGTPLDETLAIFKVRMKREAPPPSPLLEHYSGMVLSRCYRASRGRLRCITCHDPHRQPAGEEAVGFYRDRCLSCHTEASCRLPLKVRLQKTPPDDCQSCHMAKQPVRRIPHAILTSHWIVARRDEPYPEAAFQSTTPSSVRGEGTPELADLVHLSAIPGRETEPPPPLTLLLCYRALLLRDRPPDFRPRYRELLDRLAQTRPNDPLVLSSLAQAALEDKQPDASTAALRYVSRAIEAGSRSPMDYLLLAQLLARGGRLEEAVQALRQGLQLAPYNSVFYQFMTIYLMKAGKDAEAFAAAQEGLALVPEDRFLRMLLTRAQAGARAPE